MVLIIRGHRPNDSFGGKILSTREGDYENCFRGLKIFSGRGTVFLRSAYGNPPPLPSPLAHLWY